jgi:hypothetical protein
MSTSILYIEESATGWKELPFFNCCITCFKCYTQCIHELPLKCRDSKNFGFNIHGRTLTYLSLEKYIKGNNICTDVKECHISTLSKKPLSLKRPNDILFISKFIVLTPEFTLHMICKVNGYKPVYLYSL